MQRPIPRFDHLATTSAQVVKASETLFGNAESARQDLGGRREYGEQD